MRLARHLGWSLGELCERMSPGEFTLQLAFDELEPLPDPWLQTGLILNRIHAAWLKGKPPAPEDFIPTKGRARREQSPEEMMRILEGIGRRLGSERLPRPGGVQHQDDGQAHDRQEANPAHAADQSKSIQ
jgi:hypothetical protein